MVGLSHHFLLKKVFSRLVSHGASIFLNTASALSSMTGLPSQSERISD